MCTISLRQSFLHSSLCLRCCQYELQKSYSFYLQFIYELMVILCYTNSHEGGSFKYGKTYVSFIWYVLLVYNAMQLRHYFHIPLRTPISCAGMYGKLLKLCTKKCLSYDLQNGQWISGFQAATGIHMPYRFKGLVFCFLNMQSFSYI